jgi:arsenate reductase (thioredoxin)
MAEGWARHLKGEEIEAYSAGVSPKGIDPRAIRAMGEAGVDISNQRCKSVNEVRGITFDHVITLCDHAHQSCPSFPERTNVRHVGFEDPPYLARTARSGEEAMAHYRRIRDQIEAFVEGLPDALIEEGATDTLLESQGFESGIKAVLVRLSGDVGVKKKE